MPTSYQPVETGLAASLQEIRHPFRGRAIQASPLAASQCHVRPRVSQLLCFATLTLGKPYNCGISPTGFSRWFFSPSSLPTAKSECDRFGKDLVFRVSDFRGISRDRRLGSISDSQLHYQRSRGGCEECPGATRSRRSASENLKRVRHTYGGLKFYEKSDVSCNVCSRDGRVCDGPELVVNS